MPGLWQNPKRMSRKERKSSLKALLQAHDLEAIRSWVRQERSPLGTLQQALFTTDSLECRRVIEAIGLAAEIVAQSDLAAVRESVRKHFWMMNDESGNIGWHAPETIGEILCRVPVLIGEFASLLPSYFVEEPFQQGAFEAVARVSEKRPEVFRGHEPELVEALTNADAAIRAFAWLALYRIDRAAAEAHAGSLRVDTAAVARYDNESGRLIETTVAGLVQAALCQS